MSSYGLSAPLPDKVSRDLPAWSLSTSLFDWFEDDAELVCVLDSQTLVDQVAERQTTPYCNKLLRCRRTLSGLLSSVASWSDVADLTTHQQSFRQWLRSQTSVATVTPHRTHSFEGFVWSARQLHQQWLVVRGAPLPSTLVHASKDTSLDDLMDISDGEEPEDSLMTGSDKNVRDDLPVRCFMSEPLSEHQKFIRDFDWGSTPLGVMSSWDSQLVETVSLTLTGTDPAAVFWGDGMISIYNEAFISIAGQKHPSMMGDTPKNAFAEVWDQFFEPRIQSSRVTRKPFCEKALCLLLERHGYPEETYMTFTFVPLLGKLGEVVGFYHTVLEETQEVLSRRRMSLLLSTSDVLSKAENLQSFWPLLIESLGQSEYDTPFAALYSVVERMDSDTESDTRSEPQTPGASFATGHCHLEGQVGYGIGHAALVDDFWLLNEDSILAPIFLASMKARDLRILRSEDHSLPPILVQNLEKRGFSECCDTVAICPLRPTNHETALGFLVIGLSSRRPCDDDYLSFIDLLVKNVRSSIASVVLLEDEKKRGLNNAQRAAYQKAQLTARLKQRELENRLQENKFTLMAQQVPVGIFDFSPSGEINFCNQAWYSMTKHNGKETSKTSWLDRVHPHDLHKVQKEWTTVSIDRQPVSFEARLNTPWQGESDEDGGTQLDSTWALCRMYPVIADDKSIVNVIGSITDISFQKYAMAQQVQRVEEAVEAKRQQENFIDMTSHEMRNPLNAMLLCAQELSNNLQNMLTEEDGTIVSKQEFLSSSIESVETILYCGLHQKRIIDDVLTLSKLDVKLLQVIPIEVEPITMVRETLKLFESEVRAQKINVKLDIRESMKQLASAKLMLDPSRVVQILVNFIANAIKFTKTEDVREMLVSIGASKDRPTASELNSAQIQLIPHGGLYQDPTLRKNWGTGNPVYLHFVVRDTGPGICSQDMLKLFGRFAQARPKTHAHYGGSGLGLFISQQLAELQGGRVGIASEPGVGSSFYFYVKARQAESTEAAVTTTPAVAQINRQMTQSPTQRPTSSNLTGKQPDGNATSVLIVEDNLVNQKVLKKQLQRLGYNVLVANHGEEALEVIARSRLWKGDRNGVLEGHNETGEIHRLDVILMDIEMPVMDGRECIQRIREWEGQGQLAASVPVIALTANARPEQILGAKGFGFDKVISKPFQLNDVVQQITTVVSQGSRAVV